MRSKIVLFGSDLQYNGVPLSLLAVTKLLDTKENDIRIITQTEYPNYKDEILKHCADALCFGVSCITGLPIKSAIEVSKLVKKNYPSLPIIWGGWQAITLPDETLRVPYVDYLCIGQGEKTFFEFINMIKKENFEIINTIDGLSYKKNGAIIHNRKRDIEDLNVFPDFDLGLINWKKYLEVTDFGSKVLRIVTSYGCPYRCGFCCEPNNSHRQWKALSADRIVTFLKNLRSKVVFDGLIIVDNNFFISEQRVIDFCNILLDNGFHIKLGQIQGRTNVLVKYKKSTWKLLKKAGFYHILIGTESANNETLRFINKDATIEQTYVLSQLCKKYGIKLIITVIVGLPIPAYFQEDPQQVFEREFKEITKLNKDLFALDRNHQLMTFFYTPLPFSPLYEKVIELGFVPPQSLDEWGDYDLTKTHISWISKKNMVKIKTLVYISLVLALDFKHLIRTLPLIIRMFFVPILVTLKYISRLRLYYDWFSFPIDSYLFYLGLRLFKRINKVYRIINITN